MGMEDILKAIVGGAAAQPGGAQSSGDPLADLLGGILGGGMTPGGGGQPGGDPFESFQGGGAGSIADAGMGGLLESILGVSAALAWRPHSPARREGWRIFWG